MPPCGTIIPVSTGKEASSNKSLTEKVMMNYLRGKQVMVQMAQTETAGLIWLVTVRCIITDEI